jgi:hypothetical protein
MVEWLDRLRKRLAVATGGFEDLTITFNRNNSFTDPGQAVLPWSHTVTQRHATLLYQLALSRDTGFDTLGVGNYVVQTQRTFGYDYKLATKLKLIKAVPINLSYDYSFEQGSPTTAKAAAGKPRTAGTCSATRNWATPPWRKGMPSGGNPSLIPVPNYSLSLGGLQKLPGLTKVFSSLNLNHNYSGKLETAYSVSSPPPGMVPAGLNFTRNFSPLVGFRFHHRGRVERHAEPEPEPHPDGERPREPGQPRCELPAQHRGECQRQQAPQEGPETAPDEKRAEERHDGAPGVQQVQHPDAEPCGRERARGGRQPVRTLVWNTPQVPSNWKLRGSAGFRVQPQRARRVLVRVRRLENRHRGGPDLLLRVRHELHHPDPQHTQRRRQLRQRLQRRRPGQHPHREGVRN